MNSRNNILFMASLVLSLTPGADALAYVDPGSGLVATGFAGAILAAVSGFFCGLFLLLFKRAGKAGKWLAVRRRIIPITIVIAAAITAALIACSRNKEGDSRMTLPHAAEHQAGIIVVGIDGLDHGITTTLIEQGLLPNLARLARKGSFIPMNPTIPPQSPVVWTTIATGRNPGEHGIFDFIQRNPENYKLRLTIMEHSTGEFGAGNFNPVLKAEPFWKELNRNGLSTTVVRWPLTFPAEPLDGSLLAGMGVPDINGLLSRYAYYASGPCDMPADKVILVERSGNTIETFIKGPLRKGLLDTKNITVPMAIRIADDGKTAQLSHDGRDTSVAVGSWSPFLHTSFKTGITRKTPAIFKVFIERTSPDFRMYMSSLQFDPRDLACGLSFPADYAARTADRMGLFYTLGMPEDTEALEDGAISDEVFLRQCSEITAQRKAMLRGELAGFSGGALMFVFDTSDRIQHMFWRNNTYDEHGNIAKPAPEIVEHYIEMDGVVGEVMDTIREGVRLFVFSDHGFTRFDHQFDANRWLVEQGYMTLIAEPGKENSWGALFHLVDWSNTRAYGVGFAGICLNLAGREGKGIVPDEDRSSLLREIQDKLLGATGEQGEKVFENIYLAEDIYDGAFMKDAPDIVLGFRPGYRMSRQTAMGGAFDKVIAPNTNKWRGDHIMDPKFVQGVFFSSEKIELQGVDAASIARLILQPSGL